MLSPNCPSCDASGAVPLIAASATLPIDVPEDQVPDIDRATAPPCHLTATVVDDLNTANATAAPAKEKIPLLGTTPGLFRYRKCHRIGGGFSAEVFLIQRAEDKKPFVAKIIDTRQSKNAQFTQVEVRCLSMLQHPNIIRYVTDERIDENHLAIVLELADAGDLYRQFKEGVVFNEAQAMLLFVQLLLALYHIHKKRMIHRDVKSGNCFLTTSGLLKLGDFGFSRVYDENASPAAQTSTSFLGTPYYLAPEIWNHSRYGKKADVWSAGCVLFELLTARHAFSAPSQKELKEKVLARKMNPLVLPATSSSTVSPNDSAEGAQQPSFPSVEGSIRKAAAPASPPSSPARGQQHTDFSEDVVELLDALLCVDVNARPDCFDVLQRSFVRHHLRHYSRLVHETLRGPEQAAALAAIAEVEHDIHQAGLAQQRDVSASQCQGPVKVCCDKTWKDRSLELTATHLVLSLPPGKEAAPGTIRSRRLEFCQIEGAVPYLPDAGVNSSAKIQEGVLAAKAADTVVTSQGGPENYVFAVRMRRSGQTIAFAVPTEEERDMWVDRIQRVLGI